MQEQYNRRLPSLTTSRNSARGKRRSREENVEAKKKERACTSLQWAMRWLGHHKVRLWRTSHPLAPAGTLLCEHPYIPQVLHRGQECLSQLGHPQGTRPCLYCGRHLRTFFYPFSICSLYTVMGFIMAFPVKSTLNIFILSCSLLPFSIPQYPNFYFPVLGKLENHVQKG